MFLVEAKYRSLFWMLFGVFLLYGTSMTILGAVLPRVLAEFHWDYLTAGLVMAGSGIAYFVSTYLSGHLVHRFGPQPVLLGGVAVQIVGLSLFGAWADPAPNLFFSILLGLGQGGLEVTINSAVVRLDTRKTGAAMAYMQGAFALGAIAGPVALGLLSGAGASWIWIYRGMAALFVVLGLLLAFRSFVLPGVPESAGAETPPRSRWSVPPTLALAFTALFLYVGVELGVSNWVAEDFVRSFRFDPAAASFLVSVFWVGLLTGRFGVPLAFAQVSPGRQLTVSSVVAASGVLVLAVLPALGPEPWVGAVGVGVVFAAGLGCAVMYGMVLTLVGEAYPRTQARAIGFAATGGGVGAFLFPFFGSMLAQLWGIQAGFLAFAGFAVVMTAVIVLLVRSVRRQVGPTA